jgi:hypothetical protein
MVGENLSSEEIPNKKDIECYEVKNIEILELYNNLLMDMCVGDDNG